MQRKIIYTIAVIILFFFGTAVIITLKNFMTPKKVHYHAGFVVFQNNKKQDFSDYKYMNLEPCSLNKKSDTSNSDIQLEKAHLHDGVGDLVHIEREGAIWSDLFTNIHYSISYSNTTGYINGTKVNNFQNHPIHAYDSLVVFIGNNDINHLHEAVTRDYIKNQEKKSVNCAE